MTRTPIQPGDVVILDLPGAEMAKRRPALVIAVEKQDVNVVGISSTHKPIPSRSDDIPIPDWKAAGLNRPSYIRPRDIFTVSLSACRRIGVLPPSLLEQAREVVGRPLRLVPAARARAISYEVDQLRDEVRRWQAVAARLPGQPRTPDELSRALDNFSLHLRRLEQSLAARRTREPGRGR